MVLAMRMKDESRSSVSVGSGLTLGICTTYDLGYLAVDIIVPDIGSVSEASVSSGRAGNSLTYSVPMVEESLLLPLVELV